MQKLWFITMWAGVVAGCTPANGTESGAAGSSSSSGGAPPSSVTRSSSSVAATSEAQQVSSSSASAAATSTGFPSSDTPPSSQAATSMPAPSSSAEPPQSVGSAAVVQRYYSTQPSTGTLSTPPITTEAGSFLVVGVARGVWETAPDPPTDNRGNTFVELGVHPYLAYPGARAGVYVRSNAMAGAGHTFSASWGDIGGTGDEVTVNAVELRGVSAIVDSSWIERSAASSITSLPVVTTGPALLVAYWWGSGPVNQEHTAVPEAGFTIVTGATDLGDNSPNGYIQVAVATRAVTTAGSYTVTWSSTIDEGAQLYLVALQ